MVAAAVAAAPQVGSVVRRTALTEVTTQAALGMVLEPRMRRLRPPVLTEVGVVVVHEPVRSNAEQLVVMVQILGMVFTDRVVEQEHLQRISAIVLVPPVAFMVLVVVVETLTGVRKMRGPTALMV